MKTKTIKIIIEERLQKTVEIEVIDNGEESIALEEQAEEIAIKKYYNGEIILDSNDFYYREIGTENTELHEF